MTIHARLAAIRLRMRASGTELIALAPGAHLAWTLGFTPRSEERLCLLLISQETAGLLVPALDAEAIRRQTDLPLWIWSDSSGPNTALRRALIDLQQNHAQHIALDDQMRADTALQILQALPSASQSFASETIGALRLVKSQSEQAALRDNAALADRVMQSLFAEIRIGTTTEDLTARARQHFQAEGATPLVTRISCHRQSQSPASQDIPLTLQDGDLLRIDLSARRGDYLSDLTRMAVIGRPAEADATRLAVVETALQAALSLARPGLTACALDAAARQVISAAGYADAFPQRSGYGLGIEPQEAPEISQTNRLILQQGMVFTLAPAIHLPGQTGLRLGESLILQEDGPEPLSRLPRRLQQI